MDVMSLRPLDWSSRVSIACLSPSVKLKLKTRWLSSVCAAIPMRVPKNQRGKNNERSKHHVRIMSRDALQSKESMHHTPTITAPTNLCSKTQRVATLAMLTPPCLFPISRKIWRRDWKSSQFPHALTIISRYCKKLTKRTKKIELLELTYADETLCYIPCAVTV